MFGQALQSETGTASVEERWDAVVLLAHHLEKASVGLGMWEAYLRIVGEPVCLVDAGVDGVLQAWEAHVCALEARWQKHGGRWGLTRGSSFLVLQVVAHVHVPGLTMI